MDDRPRYMISVAADIVGMHPQTLRIYESKGLIRPKRTAGNTRLYSEADIERLRLIQQLTNDLGLNLAGVEQVMQLQDEVERMRRTLEPHGARDARGDQPGASPVPPRPRPWNAQRPDPTRRNGTSGAGHTVGGAAPRAMRRGRTGVGT